VKILVKLIPSEPQNNLGNDYYEQDIVKYPFSHMKRNVDTDVVVCFS